MSKFTKARWVIIRANPTSPRGKTIIGQAAEGIGYIILNHDRSRGDDIIAAFRRVENDVLPVHLTYATTQQCKALEKKLLTRNT